MRNMTKYFLAPFLALTGFRFSKNFRYEITRFHAIVYRLVDTVGSNLLAERIRHSDKMDLIKTK